MTDGREADRVRDPPPETGLAATGDTATAATDAADGAVSSDTRTGTHGSATADRTAVDAGEPSRAGRGSRVGRRRLLRRGGVVGAAALGGLVIAPAPPSRPATVDEVAGDDADAPFQGERFAEEEASPIARYQYRPVGDDYEPTAPINVVFALADSDLGLADVMDVLADAGWTDRIEEYARYAWDRERERFVHQQATAGESYLGLHGRLHVRCWSFEGVVSMQAHEDTPARPRHGIVSYADGRAAIEARFVEAGWRLAPERVDLDNDQRDHDGRASILRPGADR